MSKLVLNAIVFVAETIAHAAVIVDGTESVSPLIVGISLVAFFMACATIMPHIRRVLVIDGPMRIDWPMTERSDQDGV